MKRRALHAELPQRRGTILVVTMLIVFALASLVLALGRSMRIESLASANLAASAQAAAIERGAEQYVLAVLTDYSDTLSDLSEEDFSAVPVGDGYFWILRPDYDDSDMPLFGILDEGAKLNLNTATHDQLIRLPNMTEDLVNAILDWRDEDSTPRTNGAEDEAYASRKYKAKNAPFETVEELLLVRDFTRDLLYGTGETGPLGEANSSIGTDSSRSFMSDLATARGLFDNLTVFSAEAAAGSSSSSSSGASQQKINVNDTNARTRLRQLLRDQLGASRGDQIANSIGRNDQYVDVFHFYFQVRLTADEFDKIGPSITASAPGQQQQQSTTPARGKVNIFTAPREVLACLWDLDDNDVDTLVSARQSIDPADQSLSWIVEALDRKAIGLGNVITTTSSRFSADILAVSGNGRAYQRVRIVVDTSGTAPQVIYRRDLTQNGWPMDPQILTSLRQGQGVGSGSSQSGSSLGGSIR